MVFSRIELDIMQANELVESVELAYKHKFPAIVVHPGLASDAIRARGRVQGKFKIITPVDWPKGDNFGITKFRGLSTDALEADGFEIMLTGGKSEGDTRNEAKALTEFLKRHLSELTEVRFVLGTFVRDDANIATICRGLVGIRTPSFIRTDTQLKLQVGKANTEEHNRIVTAIRTILTVPIKISGNISGIRSITSVPDATRYAMNLVQARAVVTEFHQQPGGLRDLLKTSDSSHDPDVH